MLARDAATDWQKENEYETLFLARKREKGGKEQ